MKNAILSLAVLFLIGLKPIEEKPLKFYLPDDLQIELWAESPMLNNPTNMDTDIKGRIWVTEAVNYRDFNNDSLAFMHRSKGDRVVILEDTDGDGKADHSKVFVQDKDLVSPLGIAVLGKDIYVSCAPYLIKYTDLDGDDKPDKKEIFLKGFGGLDHDHSLHSIVAGPDGRLYFSVGNAGPHEVTDHSDFTIRSGSLYTGGTPYNKTNSGNRVSDDGKVWVGGLMLSIKPDGTDLKVHGHNFRNSYETYVDSRGDKWQNDNDDQVVTCRVSWLPEGANAGYFSEDGTRYWNADQRPSQDMFTAHWHQEDPGVMPAGDNSGAGSPTGMLRIETDLLGKKYQGAVLSADAGRNVIFSYFPEIKSSGYELKGKGRILISSNASDDKAYEWNNKEFLDDKSKWFRPSDVLIGTDGALYIADWYDAVVGGHQMKDQKGYGRIYRVSQKNKKLKTPKLSLKTKNGLLQTFKSPAINVRYQALEVLSKSGNTYLKEIKKLLKDSNSFIRSRAVYLLAAIKTPESKELVSALLSSNNAQDRVLAYRALSGNFTEIEKISMAKKMVNDPSPFVKREVIASLTDSKRNDLITAFCQNIPEGDIYYLNAIKRALVGEEESFYKNNKSLVESSFDLAFTLHPKGAESYFETIVKDENNDFPKKKKALTAIGFINTEKAVLIMQNFSHDKNKEVANLASYWLAFRSNNDWFDLYDWSSSKEQIERQKELTQMLNNKEKLQNKLVAFWDRKNSALAMAKSAIGGQILIEILKEGKLEDEIKKEIAIELNQNPDPTVRFQAQSLLSESTIQYSQEEILKIKSDTKRGREIFETYCSSCHKKENLGNSIGPDLSKIDQKLDKTGLFEAIVRPSSSLVFGYETYTLSTKSGDSYYGFILSENDKSLTIKDLSGEQHSIAIEAISKKEKDKKSIMPDAASFQFSEQNLADLLTYLTQKL
jgi:putative membrane-bound dehydrogenase-like protein